MTKMTATPIYGKENPLKIAINKFQRSRLTFDLSVKVAHIGVPSIKTVFSQTIRPHELKFHVKTSYDK